MTALPVSPKVRPFRLDTDVSPLLRLLAKAEEVDQTGELLSKAQSQLHLSVPHHDAGRDRWVIQHPDDPVTLIGHAALYLPNGSDDRRVADGMVVIHPEWRRQGLGTALFSQLEKRLREHTGDVESLRLYLDPRHQGAVAFATTRQLRVNPADTYTEMRAVLAEVKTQPILPEGFTLRSYREVNHLPTLVDVRNRGYEGIYGHHRSSEADFASRLDRFDLDGLLLLFAPDGNPIGTVEVSLAADLTERNGVPTGRVDSPGVVPEYRSLELYQVLLLSGVSYLK